MRLTTEFWIAALTRRVFGDGGYAAVIRRGSTEAGAVFIVIRNRLGNATLFGPAPQASYDSARPEERRFTELATGVEMNEVDQRVAKEMRFDPDVWLVEIEPGATGIKDLIAITTP